MSTIEIGASAEDLATRALRRRGNTIVERNYRLKSGELDIVARVGDCLVFVEVRSRGDADHGDAVETIDRRKQLRIARMAEQYLIDRAPDYERVRFDVVAINGEVVDVYEDAFRLGDLR